MDTNEPLIQIASRQVNKISRRGILFTGAVTGIAAAFAIPAIAQMAEAATSKGKSQMAQDKKNDIAVLNNGLYYEHQAIWAYNFAAGKLTNTTVGKAVLAVASNNLNDHQQHREILRSAIKSLGGTPIKTEASYDLSAYIKAGEGNIDSDVNIAKLALALETDAAIAYTFEAAKLKTPALITAGASIGTNEAAHATAIRAAFKSLGVDIAIVPASFFNPATRSAWVLKV
jgi:dihydrodipicolinate synthase/N-acetylneuraminate lyase